MAGARPNRERDPDFLIIGDLNAYALEDPITAIKAAGREPIQVPANLGEVMRVIGI